MDISKLWSEVEISKIGNISTGNTPPKKQPENYGVDIPFIKHPELQDKLILEASEYISNIGAKKARILPKNSILVSCIGNLARTGITVKESAFNQQINAITLFSGIIPKFIFYQLQSCLFRDQLENRASATTISIVNKGNFETIKVFIPPTSEQHRIVAKIEELFSELDKGIESLKTAREQLKVYRQSLLKHAFEGKLTEQWREDNADKLESADDLLARIQKERETRYQQQLNDWKTAVKEWEAKGKVGKRPSKAKKPGGIKVITEELLDKLPELSQGHCYVYLDALGDLGRGKSKHRPRNDPKLFGGKYPFIQTGEVKAAKRVVNNHSCTLSEFGIKQSKLWPKGTLCITIAANIAETAFLGFDGCFPDSFVGFTAFEKLVCPKYIELFIMSVRVRIEAYAPATAQKNINLTTLENLVVPLVSITEQCELINILDKQMSAIEQSGIEIEQNLQRSQTLRQSILKKAFSGQLVPQNPNDEPASVLLERIKAEKIEQDKLAKARKTTKRASKA